MINKIHRFIEVANKDGLYSAIKSILNISRLWDSNILQQFFQPKRFQWYVEGEEATVCQGL
jgi:hypothetical protein